MSHKIELLVLWHHSHKLLLHMLRQSWYPVVNNDSWIHVPPSGIQGIVCQNIEICMFMFTIISFCISLLITHLYFCYYISIQKIIWNMAKYFFNIMVMIIHCLVLSYWYSYHNQEVSLIDRDDVIRSNDALTEIIMHQLLYYSQVNLNSLRLPFNARLQALCKPGYTRCAEITHKLLMKQKLNLHIQSTTITSDFPDRCQAISRINTGLFIFGPLGINFNAILTKTY